MGLQGFDVHMEYSCTCNHLSPVKIVKCNSAERLLLLNFTVAGRRVGQEARFTEQREVPAGHSRDFDGG